MTPRPNILEMQTNPTSYLEATQAVIEWAKNSQSRYVCVANVHMVMETYDNADFRKVVNQADLITPDGMPLVWMLRQMGYSVPERVCGRTLMTEICTMASRENVSVGFFGGTPEVVEALGRVFRDKFPNLKVSFQYSPPFRSLTAEEDAALVQEINTSGTQILFVGLGCPKQEKWMAEHRGKVQSVMLGVGAAFNFHAGSVKNAPAWMQQSGLEWLFRALVEPRLWRRYLLHNPRFAVLGLLQVFRMGKSTSGFTRQGGQRSGGD